MGPGRVPMPRYTSSPCNYREYLDVAGGLSAAARSARLARRRRRSRDARDVQTKQVGNSIPLASWRRP